MRTAQPVDSLLGLAFPSEHPRALGSAGFFHTFSSSNFFGHFRLSRVGHHTSLFLSLRFTTQLCLLCFSDVSYPTRCDQRLASDNEMVQIGWRLPASFLGWHKPKSVDNPSIGPNDYLMLLPLKGKPR
jgi:hypothetical protein